MRSVPLYVGALVVGGILGFALWSGAPACPAAEGPTEFKVERTTLPIAEPKIPHSTVLDARQTKPPIPFRVTAPAKAPNVMIILIDDMGFGMSSAFGGPIRMPTVEKLAKGGLRYNHFHTTALCSPTRAALLTGRNHHMCNMGSITETATAFPGQTGQRPNSIAPLAETLRLNGYSTGAFGKSHETAAWEVSPSGPTDRWPTRSGFDKFYGFIGGETNQWAPFIYDGLTQVETPKTPNYHFMNDMTNQAIGWMRYEKSLTPEKPFFMYFAPGATHAPHHVPKEWIAKNKGRFDQGWDKLRDETLTRQIKLGLVPQGTKLAPKPQAIKDWDKLTANEKKLFARQMEIYSGFGEYADHEIGRLIGAVEELGQMDNTLIFYIVGDNGTSAEGGMVGVFNESSYFNSVIETVDDILKHYDDLGSSKSYPHMAAGWAVAGDTPFTWTKQVASNFGGTRNGMVIHWPQGIKARGEIREQFHHVIDVAPTILQAAGLPQPKSVNGTAQTPIEGVSMVYTFDQPQAKTHHTTQYFEIFGNRAIFHDGWLAGTVHKAPWEPKNRATFENDVWELYDTSNDFSLANNLAAKNPAKLKELQNLFMKEAVKYQVLPLDDRLLERLVAKLVGRPDLIGDRTVLKLYPGMKGMSENAFIGLKNISHSITADVEIPQGGANGVILAQAGRFGGWSLYLKDGKPTYTYNFLGMDEYHVRATESVPAGKAQVYFSFAYDGGGRGKGGTGILYVNGKKLAEAHIPRTQPNIFSADETADVGVDEATPVTAEYREGDNAFTGTIRKVVVQIYPSKTVSKADKQAELESVKARKLAE